MAKVTMIEAIELVKVVLGGQVIAVYDANGKVIARLRNDRLEPSS
jgi:hypothetical protein